MLGGRQLIFLEVKLARFIRIELIHYPLHIIHRFKIEKKIFEEQSIDDLPDLWNLNLKNF